MILASIASATATPPPIEIDARPCELCGMQIDRHDQIDTPEGPEFFCADIDPGDMTLDELKRRAELIQREQIRAMVEPMGARRSARRVDAHGRSTTA